MLLCLAIAPNRAWSQSVTVTPQSEAMPMSDAAMADMPGMSHAAQDDMEMSMDQPMTGAFGPYPMTREASGTSWQPQSAPHAGAVFSLGDWMAMAHGFIDGIYDRQGGPRGGSKAFSTSMGMLMGQRPLGDDGTVGLRAMMSLDPLMGANGYPLLFATGETANGRQELIDRQHPHDLFMELSASYSYRLSSDSSAFLYAGLPGEPALGPPAFMHRVSGEDIPEAPITHHWLDSTHITYGVLTAGYVDGDWKIEASVFKGREPDQHRYDIEGPQLDSVSTRLSYNPTPDWSLQVSWGYLHSPEQLMPNVDENRVTASATYNLPFGLLSDDDADWATTIAWGQKNDHPGHALNGFLLESELVLRETHTVFARAERVDEDELFPDGSPLRGRIFTPGKLSVGYIYDVPVADHLKLGIGGEISRYAYPAVLDAAYGDNPTSFMVFLRLKLR
jgi:hypothetical protein